MEFKLDTGTGYLYCYNPEHYCANRAGKVMEHVYVMAEALNRKLLSYECVHHIDRDKTNNHISNLKLMTIEAHSKLHQMEDNGVQYVTRSCITCKSTFEVTTKSDQKYCSASCASKNREKFSISKEDLEILVWSMPTTRVAESLGISDVAVAKRCKKLGVSKPPRGYWRKVETGTL